MTKSTISVTLHHVKRRDMSELKRMVGQIRAFNRFYTDLIGLLDKHLLNSNYSLAEVRILFEINIGQPIQASQIMEAMHIDKSYLSRLVKKLEKEELVVKEPSQQDARAYLLSLTIKGQELFDKLNLASDKQIHTLINSLPTWQQQELVSHMTSITNILNHSK